MSPEQLIDAKLCKKEVILSVNFAVPTNKLQISFADKNKHLFLICTTC